MTQTMPPVAKPAPIPETATVGLDQAIQTLQAHKQAWAEMPIARKILYLRHLKDRVNAVAPRWVAAAIQAKGIPTGSPIAGEEWSSGPWAMLYGLSQLIETLNQIARDGAPHIPSGALHTRPDGQLVVDVFPQTVWDRVLLTGMRAEVWMQPGVTAQNLRDNMAAFYREKQPVGKVALVLGAGNIASIAPLDVLYKLIAEGHVSVLKMNPVNEYVGPFLEEAFSELIDAGFVRIVYGGAKVGAELCAHPGIDEIHITGSANTHDTIVFGAGEDGRARKAANTPILRKHITSELGNVSPTIVVPGPWTPSQIRYHAENIASQKMHNGGFNCIACQVVILPETWEKSGALMNAIDAVLKGVAPRYPYYPGADLRQQSALANHPDAELVDAPGSTPVPRTIVHGVSADHAQDFCFQIEAFGAVLTETRLPGADAATFLRNAVVFCNDTLWGTLGANIIIHPQTVRELGPAFQQAIADLRYGCIAVNTWTGVGFLIPQASWGAYPGHTLNDIQSGIGVVHNALLFDRPQKSVIYAPFVPPIKPPWYITNKTADRLMSRVVPFEHDHQVGRLVGIFNAALRA